MASRPDVDNPSPSLRGDDELLRKMLIPVASASPSGGLRLGVQMAEKTGGELRLVHVRIYDPPFRGGAKFYAQTEEEAVKVVERSLDHVWAAGLAASGIVVNAERHRVAAALAAEAVSWDADVVIMARRARRGLTRWLVNHLSDEVTLTVPCPVLIVSEQKR